MLSSEKMQWFAMRATYRRGMQIKALLDKEGINNFIPMRYEVRIRNGRKRRELVPVISDLIFVHSVQSELQKVKFKLPYFQYMIDIRNGQKIIVPDDQMRQFIAVAGTYDEHLIFFSPDEVNLRKGTKVRITGGDFEGYEGVVCKGERCERPSCGYQSARGDSHGHGDAFAGLDRSDRRAEEEITSFATLNIVIP